MDWKIPKKRNKLLLLTILLLASSCWYYSFKGTLPPHIKTIAIPTFDNQTAEFNIEETITDGIRAQFIQENILKLRDENDSDSILSGKILSVTDSPLVYKDTQLGEEVEEYRVTIKVSIEWYDRINDKIILKKQVTGYGDYDPSGATDNTREKALDEAIKQISEEIINSILAIW